MPTITEGEDELIDADDLIEVDTLDDRPLEKEAKPAPVVGDNACGKPQSRVAPTARNGKKAKPTKVPPRKAIGLGSDWSTPEVSESDTSDDDDGVEIGRLVDAPGAKDEDSSDAGATPPPQAPSAPMPAATGSSPLSPTSSPAKLELEATVESTPPPKLREGALVPEEDDTASTAARPISSRPEGQGVADAAATAAAATPPPEQDSEKVAEASAPVAATAAAAKHAAPAEPAASKSSSPPRTTASSPAAPSAPKALEPASGDDEGGASLLASLLGEGVRKTVEESQPSPTAMNIDAVAKTLQETAPAPSLGPAGGGSHNAKPAATKGQGRVMPKADLFSEPPRRSEPGQNTSGPTLTVSSAVGAPASLASVAAAARGKEQPKASPASVPLRQPALAPCIREEDEAAEEEETQEVDQELQDEWADVGARTEEMRQKELANVGRAVKEEDDVMYKPISYKEVRDWLFTTPPDPQVLQPLNEEEVTDVRCGCIGRGRARSEIPGLERRLWPSKDVVLSLKMTHFDFNEVHHFRMIRTMYLKLTRNKVCPSIGNHWVDFGFQGGDPCTDLNRCGGVLNIVMLFYFFSHHFDLMKAAFLLAGSAEQHFPLACVSINITQMVVNSLLEGQLSAVCNGAGASCDVLETMCKVHASALHYFSHRWRTQKRTIRDTEKTMNEVRSLLHRPRQLLQELTKGEEENRSKNDPNRWEFTDIEFGGSRRPSPGAGGNTSAANGNAAPAGRLRNYDAGEG